MGVDRQERIDLKSLPGNCRLWVGTGSFNIFTPQQIIDHLNQYVIGQDAAKKLLAITTANHLAAEVYNNSGLGEDPISSTNILLTGPSGSGKTYLLQTLAKLLKRPFLSVDITHYSPTGYVGKNVHSILEELMTIAETVEEAERAIILIDEVDKISKHSNAEDFGSTSIQRSLLKMVEGDKIEVKREIIDTSKILWVFAGSFDTYLTAQVKEQTKVRPGFGDAVPEAEAKVPELTHKKLVELGMLREFVGRVGHITQLTALTSDDYRKILTEVRGAPLKQIEAIAEARGIGLKVTDQDIETIIQKAVDLGVGARGLRVIAEQHFIDQLI